jgi:predicted CXXCH cytochrome family protein
MLADFNALQHSHYVSDPKYGDSAGCESCHGPASAHVADPQKRHIYRFTVRSPENARRTNEACLRCHQETIKRPHFEATEHARTGMSCASCHEVHYHLKTPYLLRFPGVGGPAGQPMEEAKLKEIAAAQTATTTASPPPPASPSTGPPPASPPAGAAPAPPAGRPATPPRRVNRPKLEMLAKTRVPIPSWRTSFTREADALTDEQTVVEVCASCHRRQINEARQFSHHPILEGRVKCNDCHDPHHAVLQGRMFRRVTVADTCLQCHQQIRGPFVYEHDPVKAGGIGEDCLECHRPHGSPNRNLLTTFSRGLCVQCHTDIQQDPAHRARGGDCWRSGCHVAVHGSNHSALLFVE